MNIHRILDQQEDSRDEILHQFLGAKTERHTDDAGAGEQRTDIDANGVQGGHDHHQRNHGEERKTNDGL